MAISTKDIWAAADALDVEGLKPTLQAVRKKLGGGSFTTISDAMSEWKSKKAAAAGKPKEPLPTPVAERFSEVAAELWNLAMEAAHARLDEERRSLAEKQGEMETRLAEAVELADTLTQEVEELRAQVADLQGFKDQATRLGQQLVEQERTSAEQLSRAHERADNAESAAAEERRAAGEATERAARTEGQVEAYKAQLAELTAVVKALDGRTGPKS